MTTGRAVLIGAVLGLVAVAVAVALVATGVVQSPRRSDAPVQGPVLVALVMPDESGTLEPQLIDVYSRTPAGWSVASVSPTLPAAVSGTSARTLADAYTFGGGTALAKAYEGLGRGTATSWIVVSPQAWTHITGSKGLQIDVPADMQVFDGTQLVGFNEGSMTIPPTEVPLLFDGARYLSASQNASVRAQIGDLLGNALGRAGSAERALLETSLAPSQLALWLGSTGQVSRDGGD